MFAYYYVHRPLTAFMHLCVCAAMLHTNVLARIVPSSTAVAIISCGPYLNIQNLSKHVCSLKAYQLASAIDAGVQTPPRLLSQDGNKLSTFENVGRNVSMWAMCGFEKPNCCSFHINPRTWRHVSALKFSWLMPAHMTVGKPHPQMWKLAAVLQAPVASNALYDISKHNRYKHLPCSNRSTW